MKPFDKIDFKKVTSIEIEDQVVSIEESGEVIAFKRGTRAGAQELCKEARRRFYVSNPCQLCDNLDYSKVTATQIVGEKIIVSGLDVAIPILGKGMLSTVWRIRDRFNK